MKGKKFHLNSIEMFSEIAYIMWGQKLGVVTLVASEPAISGEIVGGNVFLWSAKVASLFGSKTSQMAPQEPFCDVSNIILRKFCTRCSAVVVRYIPRLGSVEPSHPHQKKGEGGLGILCGLYCDFRIPEKSKKRTSSNNFKR